MKIRASHLMNIFIMLSWVIQLNGYFSRASIWQRSNSIGDVQTVVLLGDQHDSHTCETEQLTRLAKYIPSDALVLVENTSELAYDAPFFERFDRAINSYCVTPFQGSAFLWQIPKECKSLGCAVINLEFRQYSSHFLRLLSEIKNNERKVTCAQLSYWLDRIIWKIETYLKKAEDRTQKNYFRVREKIQEIKDHFAALKKCSHILTETDYKHHYISDIENALKEHRGVDIDTVYLLLSSVQNQLLDVRFIQRIARASTEKNIFIVAGSWHVKNIETYMDDCGFHEISAIADTQNNEPVNVEELLNLHFLPVRIVPEIKIKDDITTDSRFDPHLTPALLMAGFIAGTYFLYDYAINKL